MIEFVEVMFRALTGLKLTFPTLIALSAFFALGYYFAALTKRMNPLKAVLALFLGYLLSTLLSGMLGVFTLALVLGFLSNQGLFLARAILWVESLAEFAFVIAHRATYEDIRREEDRAQAQPAGTTHREHTRQKGGGHQGGQSRQKGHTGGGQSQNRQQGAGASRGSSSDTWSPRKGNKADIRKAMRILELPEEEEFTEKDIAKAWRKRAMKLHPDMPKGNHEAFVQLGIAKEFLMAEVG